MELKLRSSSDDRVEFFSRGHSFFNSVGETLACVHSSSLTDRCVVG